MHPASSAPLPLPFADFKFLLGFFLIFLSLSLRYHFFGARFALPVLVPSRKNVKGEFLEWTFQIECEFVMVH